jgi:hypothetical protein
MMATTLVTARVCAMEAKRAMRRVQRLPLAGCIGIATLLSACAGAAVFADAGVGNGDSTSFQVPGGQYAVEYEARDREPWFGCDFGVALVAPEDDPLAPGRVVATTDVIAVAPRGSAVAALTTEPMPEGEYFIRYLGSRPCDWAIRVTSR